MPFIDCFVTAIASALLLSRAEEQPESVPFEQLGAEAQKRDSGDWIGITFAASWPVKDLKLAPVSSVQDPKRPARPSHRLRMID